jgi:hypothetical protein
VQEPTASPTDAPTESPTTEPSANPSVEPTHAPSGAPTAQPAFTAEPTAAPTECPFRSHDCPVQRRKCDDPPPGCSFDTTLELLGNGMCCQKACHVTCS